MKTARLLSVLAASSLAGIAYGQTQTAPATSPSSQSNTPPATAPAPGYNTSSPSSASSPHQRAVTGMRSHETPPNANPGPAAAATAHQDQSLRMAEAGPGGHPWSNMPVETSSGQSLGSVSSVVPGLNGHKSSGYVVVSGANGMSVPVPYRTAHSMVRGGKLILSQSRLEHAPKVTQEDLQNNADHAWRMKADQYWRAKGHGHDQK
ncbi:MAG TPA: hypothetical protein VF745_04125 [Steroidobacteraceae bacterium]